MTTESEKTVEMPVVMLTDAAVAKIKEIIQNEGLDGYGLRVVAMPMCSGVQYGLDFDDTANEGDEIVEVQGIKVYVDIDSVEVLRGSTIDYASDVYGEGFKFLNPNVSANSGCGCCCDDSGCGGGGCGH